LGLACGEGCLDAARGLAFGLVAGLAAWGVIAAAAAALV
jgi:hypothetical protein